MKVVSFKILQFFRIKIRGFICLQQPDNVHKFNRRLHRLGLLLVAV